MFKAYTIVASDYYGGALCSHFVTHCDGHNALDARERFLRREETKERKYVVHGVFLGTQTELLSTYETETLYLGNYQPRRD